MRRLLATALLLAVGLVACDDDAPEATSPTLRSALDAPLAPLALGLWGDGDRLWVVGGEGQASWIGRAPLDGGEALELASVPHPDGPPLWWIWGDGEGHLRACGAGGRILARDPDGEWRAEDTGLDARATLFGVWGSSVDDLWAVGGSASAQGPKGIVLRSEGGGPWRRLEDPALPDDLSLYKVWGRAADDIYIVGEGGVSLRWDGETLRRVDVPDLQLMFTVHGAADGPTLAVGGRQRGRAWRWAEDQWVEEPLPGLDGHPLNGVYVRPDGSAIAVGAGGAVIARDAAGRWGPPALDVLGAGDLYTLHAVWAPGLAWAVGGAIPRGRTGIVLREAER